MSRQDRTRPGVTMIELLVILAILAFLLAFLIPAVQKVREAAGRTQDINNLKQLALSVHSFAGAYNQKLPPPYAPFGRMEQSVTLHVHLMPYIEQEPLYRMFLKEKGDVDANVPQFRSPMDPSDQEKIKGIQNYAANLRVFSTAGQATNDPKREIDLKEADAGKGHLVRTFQDGTSNTIIFATKYAHCGDGGSRYASAPRDKTAAFIGQKGAEEKASADSAKATFQLAPGPKECLCSPLMAQSFTKARLAIALGDGSARHVLPSLSVETWNSAMHPNEGQVLGDDWND